MTDHRDDCYFYYYSTCTKGDSCPFRHCEAAMGNETVCSLWKEGGCFRKACMFRHMEIKKNRKEIACYWEKQPAGCQKPHCAFYHEKPRVIEGVYVPPSKGVAKVEEPPQVEPVPPPVPLPTAANPQLRGVIKAETQETVPSPTHPPVVINPADDDEDEDDQYSEGEDGMRLISPRKLPGGPNSREGLNFGVSTLEEVRLRKALKASMKRAGYPVQDADGTPRRSNGAYGEKENLQGFGRPACLIASNDPVARDDAERPRGSLAQRLGKKFLNNDVQRGEQLLLHRGLAARLGGVVDEVDAAPLMALRPIRERLGSPDAPAAPGTLAPEARGEARKPPTQKIRIKTLEEIRQEKAAKARIGSSFDHSSSSSKTTSSAHAGPTSQGCPRPPRGSRRTVTVVKAAATTSSINPPAKRMRQQQAGKEEKQGEEVVGACREKPPGPNEAKQALTTTTAMATPVAEVRVKTLEEIRREKAARVMQLQAQEAQNGRGPAAATDEVAPKKPRLLRVTKPDSPAGGAVTQKPAEAAEKPVLKAAEPGPTSSGGVTVKTFEEIMREKRLRRQEQEEKAASSGSQSPSSTSAETDGTPKRKAPPTEGSVSPEPSAIASPTSAAQKAPLVKATLVPSSDTASPKKSSSSRQGRGRSSPHGPDDAAATKAVVASPVKVKGKLRPQRAVTGAAASKGQGFSQDAPPAVQAQSNSPAKPAETKVRPKVNVKPSMIRPSERVRPGQKRKAAERSAVAAVKPLNSASSAPEEALQESPCKSRTMFLSSHSETPVAPRSPSPLREELQADPVFQRSAVPSASSREACALPRSPPAARPPGQARPRRPSSVSASAAAAVDDFEELMNEFNSGDQLEGDIDPSLGEDDLLQELSEMIDS